MGRSLSAAVVVLAAVGSSAVTAYHPRVHARERPDKPAIVMGAGGVTTYADLEAGANRLAHLLRAGGLRPGDGIALLSENHPRFFEVAWAAQRSGLYFTAVNSHLTADEVEFIVNDSGARALVVSRAIADVARAVAPRAPRVEVRLAIDGGVEGYDDYDGLVGPQPADPIPDEQEGTEM